MNITLIYNESKFNIDILNDTPCQYLYNMATKIFRLPLSKIKLFYKNKEIENNSRLVFTVLGQIDPENYSSTPTIIVEKIQNSSTSLNPMLSTKTSGENLPPLNTRMSESSKLNNRNSSKKKYPGAMLCQICNHKNSIYYCRICNLFVCFECNVRYNEHKNHDKINLEDGDAFLGCDVYREEIIKDINIIELGFKQTQQWMIDNTDREAFLQGLFKSLEYIRSHSLNLADMKTMYSLDEEMINDFKTEIDKIQVPKHRDEIFEIFSNLNLKENELRNYTKFLNLQIIKSEYNKVLLKCLDKVKQNMDKLSDEVKARLAECEDIKFRNINDIKLYLKEYGMKKNKDDVENFLSKNYVNKQSQNDDEDKMEDNNKTVEENEINNDDNNNTNDKNNNKNLTFGLNTDKANNSKKKSIFLRNKLSMSNLKLEGSKSITEKKLKGLKILKTDKAKNKFSFKELINNFSVTNIPKKKEVLVPLKINKKISLKKNQTSNEISSIEKPKNLKKFLFSKQELSEADFQDFPFNLKKKEKDKNMKEPPKKNESEDNEINEVNQYKNNLNLNNIDFSSFIGTEKKISFLSPSRGRNNHYRRSIFQKTKAIFENL